VTLDRQAPQPAELGLPRPVEVRRSHSHRAVPSRSRHWPALTLTAGQLGIMGANVLFSLSLGYAGGIVVVGATAPAVLVFQVVCGVLQRALAEATLLMDANTERRADRATSQWSIAAALLFGLIGAVIAAAASVVVPQAPVLVVLAYAAGIPFAIALDIGRSAGVAAGAPRSAFFETVAWFGTLGVAILGAAAMHSPLGVALAWAGVNLVFFLGSTLEAHRRPRFRGLLPWARARRNMMGPASADALMTGVVPLLAIQMTAFVVAPATIGAVRIIQQLLAPLAFVSITLRRVLIYRRSADRVASTRESLRDALLSAGLMAAGAALLAVLIALVRQLTPALLFVPVGLVLVAGGIEKIAQGFSFGSSLNTFVRGDFRTLLRARYVMLVATLIMAPLMAFWWGAVGYLVGSAAAMVLYSAVILPPRRQPRHS
jgi:hypothetical protein